MVNNDGRPTVEGFASTHWEAVAHEDEELLEEQGDEFADAREIRSDQAATCYEILGVSPGASRDEIKAAFRNRINQYHPDKVHNLGDKLKRLAESETKELNHAYQEAMKRR